ncbi:MAG: DUF2007 domain-containing protein [Pseudomonadales bacterium]|nr:DUF2007 domain-containing protein [Pseudomonadales bacterium]
MRTVYEASNSVEGHMVANLLEQAKIYARVDGDFLQGGVGELQAFGVVKVAVNNDDYDRAKQLVMQWEASQPSLNQVNDSANQRSSLSLIPILVSFAAGVLVGMLLMA